MILSHLNFRRVHKDPLVLSTPQTLTSLVIVYSLIQLNCDSLFVQSKEVDIEVQNYQQFIDIKDPVVWDEKSLYKNKLEKLPHQRYTSLSSRWKRSAQITHQQAAQHQQVVDACQSKMEIVTPYYATNSKGKLRTVINSKLMQQAIQVETCIRSPTSESKCNSQRDCGCDQKYKWHRLLVMDPRDGGSSQGLFMDWFLFPSNCVCRCKSDSRAQLLRAIKKAE